MRIRLIAIILLSLLCFTACDRDGEPLDANPVRLILQPRGQKTTTTRPRAPERQKVELTYDGRMLTVSFEIPEGLCTLTLRETDSKKEQKFMIDSNKLTDTFPVRLQGPAEAAITTPSGKVYEGMLNIKNLSL